MNAADKINVLVIPDLFPEDDEDMKGIFIPDYLNATSPWCNNTVLVLKLQGKEAGLKKERKYNSDLIRFSFGFGKIRSFLKAYYYRKYFTKGISLASGLKDIQIIHAHGSILAGTIAQKLSEKWKIPFVVTEHAGPFSQIKNKAWKFRWTKNILEKADAVLNVSAHAEAEIKNSGIVARRSYVTYNPVDTALFIPSSAKEKVMLFAGRLDEFKGAMIVLKAFSQLSEKCVDWKLKIIGEGEDLSAITKFLLDHPLIKERVILKGVMPKRTLAAEMAKCAFFVFPSRHETFGLVLAEALSCGLPVIGPDRTGPSEFIHEGNGIRIDPDSQEDLIAAMEKMIFGHEKYQAEKIRTEVIDRFGFSHFGKSLSAVYSGTIKNYKA